MSLEYGSEQERLIAEQAVFLSGLNEEQQAATSPETRQALEMMSGYLKPDIDGLWHADRLRRGLPLGSGMVAGACKNVIGRRMKSNRARWIPDHADQMTALPVCAIQYRPMGGILAKLTRAIAITMDYTRPAPRSDFALHARYDTASVERVGFSMISIQLVKWRL